MKSHKKLLDKIDNFQQRHNSSSLMVGIIKKYLKDNGSKLSIQLTYTTFVTAFPLLLLLITLLTLVASSDPSIKKDVLDSTFSQFPVVGNQLKNNIHVLKKDSIVSLVVSLLILIYGCTSLATSGRYVMEEVWDADKSLKLNFIHRFIMAIKFLIVLGIGLAITTALSGYSAYGRHNVYIGLSAELLAIAANVVIYYAAFKVLTPKIIKGEDLIPGAVFGGIAWSILQAFGSYIVAHYLRNDNATYGAFGAVLGLVAWLYLGAELTVFAAEVNTVIKQKLWPVSLFK